jgi:CrcB protein
MKSVLLVALGGALGSVARYKLAGLILLQTPVWRFPLGTFVVNVLGCIVIGILAGLAIKYEALQGDARLFLFTGVLGGFTTFSAFGLETFHLIRRGELAIAFGYVLASVAIGLLAVAAGHWIGHQFGRYSS